MKSRILTSNEELELFSKMYFDTTNKYSIDIDFLKASNMVRVFYNAKQPNVYLGGYSVNTKARNPLRYLKILGKKKHYYLKKNKINESEIAEIVGIFKGKMTKFERIQFFVFSLLDARKFGKVILGGSFNRKFVAAMSVILSRRLFYGTVLFQEQREVFEVLFARKSEVFLNVLLYFGKIVF